MDFRHLLEKAKNLEKALAELDKNLKSHETEGSAGSGAVTVKVNGAGDVIAMKLDPELVATGDTSLEEQHEKLMRGFATEVGRHPSAFPQLLQSVVFAAGPSHEIVITGKPGAEDTKAMLRALDQLFLPNAVVIFRPDEEAPPITDLVPYTREQRAIDGKATAYVCRNFACNKPTTSIEEMLGSLSAPE